MGGSPSAPPPPDNSAMIAELAAMRQQQAEAAKTAAEAQRQAMIDAQNNAAQQGMNQSNAMANQNLMRQQEYQRAMDASASENAYNQALAMGQSMTGGGLDLNAINQARMENYGVQTSYVPSTMGKQAIAASGKNEDEKKAKLINTFGVPNLQGLVLGGS